MKSTRLNYAKPKDSYTSTKAYIIREQESLNLKSNLTNIFELSEKDKYAIYDKTTDRVIEVVSTTAVCIHILNQYEMFEHSKELYDLIKEYFVFSYVWLEQSSDEEAETEFNVMFMSIMEDLQKAQNAFR